MNERTKLLAMMATHIYCAYNPLVAVYPASSVHEAEQLLKEVEKVIESRVETLLGGVIGGSK